MLLGILYVWKKKIRTTDKKTLIVTAFTIIIKISILAYLHTALYIPILMNAPIVTTIITGKEV